MQEILKRELLAAEKRLVKQMDLLKESKDALDAALANRMVALATACDARCKRQAAAVAATQASIVELQAAIGRAESNQRDLVNEASANSHAPSAASEASPPVTPGRRR